VRCIHPNVGLKRKALQDTWSRTSISYNFQTERRTLPKPWSSAGGEAKALLLVNIGPGAADIQETTNSLGFAARARNVELTLGNKENAKKWRDMVSRRCKMRQSCPGRSV
jgi:hypothetical protein